LWLGIIRAVASVAGGIARSDCPGAVAALLLHNPHDRAVPLSAGERARDVLLGRPGDAARWVSERVGAFGCRRYGDPADPLFWCRHAQDVTPRGRYYPHQWLQGGAQGIRALRHPRRLRAASERTRSPTAIIVRIKLL
jgi:polyhydroxybutyrate depolymerase